LLSGDCASPLVYEGCVAARRTAVINQIRSFLLERGIAVRQGLRFLRQQLPEILAKRIDV